MKINNFPCIWQVISKITYIVLIKEYANQSIGEKTSVTKRDGEATQTQLAVHIVASCVSISLGAQSVSPRIKYT